MARNAPTVWFLEEARTRGLISELTLDVPDHPSEVSAGGALVRDEGDPQVLVLRVRDEGYELPKGGIEWDELPEEAAVRETREEAAVAGPLLAGRELGYLDYPVDRDPARYLERVGYFELRSGGPLRLGATPTAIRERRWLRRDEVGSAPLVNEGLRPLLLDALARVSPL